MTRWPRPDDALARRYRAAGAWGEQVLADHVAAAAARTPAKAAVHDLDGSWTYAELAEASARVASGLAALGVRSGDVVVVQVPARREFVAAALAVERLGAGVCPLVPGLGSAGLAAVLRLARPRAVVTVERHRGARPVADVLEAAAAATQRPEVVVAGGEAPVGTHAWEQLARAPATAPAPVDPDGLAELAFTSGTTGEPKGVLHSHNTSLAGIRSTVVRQQVTARDVVHVGLPVGHNYGYFYGVRLGLVAGATLVLQDGWDAERMLELATRHRVTVSAGTPTHLADLLALHEHWRGRLDTLRLYTCAGAKLPAELARRTLDALPGRLSRAFGMTEIGHVTATGPDAPADKVILTEGSPQPEVELRILGSGGAPQPPGTVGEVAFRSPFQFLGYVQGAERTAAALTADGFFLTGDLGYADANGYLVITGRAKELIIRGGENIAPAELEDALSGQPGIADVAVVGVPDERLGERPVACVTAAGEPPTLERLRQLLSARGVSRRHWPEACVVVEAIPRSETGKVLREQLRTAVAERAARALGEASR